jgi:sugar-specific transcriptional regulator TrmB
METDPQILKRLKELGLGAHEGKAYLSLLEKETLTVTEVSRLAGIPRANAYEALEKLLSKGFCVSKPGDIKRYSASPPSLLQERMLTDANRAMEEELGDLENRRLQVAGRWKKVADDVGRLAEELTPLFQGSRSQDIPLEYIEVIKDSLQIHRRIMELSAQARKEILIFSKVPYAFGRIGIEQQTKQQVGLIKEGLKIRSIVESSPDSKEAAWQTKVIAGAMAAGKEFRETEKLPMKMAIYDTRISLFALDDPLLKRSSLTTVVIEHEALALGLKMLFECYWSQSREVAIPVSRGRGLAKGG